MKEPTTQQLVLEVMFGEITTYAVQVLFTHGVKPGETPHERWSFISGGNMPMEVARHSVRQWKEDGYKARIVKITTKAEVISHETL